MMWSGYCAIGGLGGEGDREELYFSTILSTERGLLGREGVNPNKPDDGGRAPLWWAAWNGHVGATGDSSTLTSNTSVPARATTALQTCLSPQLNLHPLLSPRTFSWNSKCRAAAITLFFFFFFLYHLFIITVQELSCSASYGVNKTSISKHSNKGKTIAFRLQVCQILDTSPSIRVTESTIITTIHCSDVGYCLFRNPLVTHIAYHVPSLLL